MREKINKNAQAWGTDLMVGFTLFFIGIVFFYLYALNQPGQGEEAIEKLFYDGKIIANSILSEGHPENWNSSNVIKTGILSNNKINETKLTLFYNLSLYEYDKTRILFNTRYDYYFFLNSTITIDSVEQDGIGKPGEDRNNIPTNSNIRNLVKITRFTVYKNKPITAYLYIWEE